MKIYFEDPNPRIGATSEQTHSKRREAAIKERRAIEKQERAIVPIVKHVKPSSLKEDTQPHRYIKFAKVPKDVL